MRRQCVHQFFPSPKIRDQKSLLVTTLESVVTKGVGPRGWNRSDLAASQKLRSKLEHGIALGLGLDLHTLSLWLNLEA